MINKEELNDSKNISIDIPDFMDTTDILADNEVLIQLKYFLFPKIMIYFRNSDKLHIESTIPTNCLIYLSVDTTYLHSLS